MANKMMEDGQRVLISLKVVEQEIKKILASSEFQKPNTRQDLVRKLKDELRAKEIEAVSREIETVLQIIGSR